MIDTSATYHLAYTVATTIYVGYMLWLWRRGVRARRRVDELQRTKR